jgi:oligosaccharide repeat unit polymerase
VEYKKTINPITIYAAIWVVIVGLYEIRMVNYFPLSNTTYLIIISFFIIYSFGNLLGHKIVKISRKPPFAKDIYEKKLFQVIMLTMFIAAIAIVPNTFILIQKYGVLGLFSSTVEIYYEREFGTGLSTIGYFSPVIFTSLIFVSVHIKKFGLKKSFLFVFILAIMNVMTFGGRNNIIISLFSVIIPLFAFDNKIKLTKKSKIWIGLGISVFIIVFSIINNARANVTTVSNFVAQQYSVLFQSNQGLYKIYTYMTGPLGYLNSYLQDPYFSFGANTFLPIYKQLVKVGFDIELMSSLPFRNIPISTNVGTYITELIIDFSIPGAFAFILIFGFLVGVYAKRIEKYESLSSYFIVTMFLLLIMMSFFMWYMRSINLWIATFVGIMLSRYVESRKILVFKNSKIKKYGIMG